MTMSYFADAQRGGIDLTGRIVEEYGGELVRLIRRLRAEGLYSNVELRITSPGGVLSVVEEYQQARPEFAARGVTVTTHVPTVAASAAALLASLGDVRTAAPSATLQYHAGRAIDAGTLTARGAARLHARIAEADVWQITALTERALRTPSLPSPKAKAKVRDFQATDWPVIARLLDSAEGTRRQLLARLRERVAQAMADPGECAGLYVRLLGLDAPISAYLAAELRLIDWVAEPDSTDASHDGPCVQVPEWAALYPPDGRVPTAALCRHVLIMGETGSGKTASGILPVVSAMLARGSPMGCMLVIDPKDEIGPAIARMGGAADVRVIDLATDSIDLMAGRHAIAEDLEAGRFVTAAGRILRRAASFDPSNPARTLGGARAQTSDPYWDTEGARLATTILAFTLMIHGRAAAIFGTVDAPGSMAQMEDVDAWQDLVRLGERLGVARRDGEIDRIAHELRHDEDAKHSIKAAAGKVRESELYRASPGFRRDLKALIRHIHDSASGDGEKRRSRAMYALGTRLPLLAARCVAEPVPRPNLLTLAGDILQAVWAARPPERIARHLRRTPLCDGEAEELLDQIVDWWGPLARAERQYCGLIGMARMVFAPFSDATPGRVLRVGPEPGAASLDFGAAVDSDTCRTVYVYRPGLRRDDALIARVIKARYFEAVLDSVPRKELDDMPLAVYVADEFHRFVTSDPSHGEQSYVDTCRSQQAACVLATQSVASLRHAMSEVRGAGIEDAIRILIANTATKLAFRSTESGVRDLVESLAPGGPDRLPITEIRPPTTLRVGECYAALSDGRFDRVQLRQYTPSDRR